ncbi:MAG TPA: MlaD family protein [Thermoleophilaceae bacterium]|jgi:ABC-type transporter Mla subunit MlaD|nr:MlaD family protein [Thermoleophilaceae bacterium]
MRRFVYLGLLVAILPWIVIGIARESTDDDTRDAYFVRAIFDNASTVVNGEDVKVAGVPVGVVSDLDVTGDKKAAVTLRIDDARFIPWKRDAHCVIGSQGLIGEKFLDCEPGTNAAKPLARVEEGNGKGERLLPVGRTSSPVDLDLVNDIMRLPYRQRFAILISEFGTGLAARGEDLNEVIHRANPALRETDKVLKILADQNRTLAQLARDSDTALAPLARERESFADFIVQANATGEASAERRGDLRQSIRLLPGFLSELRPLMADLEGFADQGTPLLTDLNAAAPALGRLIKAQGTFSDASREAFPSLGDALERGRPALIDARPLIRDLGELGQQTAPVAVNLDKLTKSLEDTGALQRLNDVFYSGALVLNGFDGLGHYLRTALLTNVCSTYAVEFSSGCGATFYDPTVEASSASTGQPLQAANAKAARRTGKGSVPPTGSLLQELLGQGDASVRKQREQNLAALRRRSRQQSPALDGSEAGLEYLLGGEGG